MILTAEEQLLSVTDRVGENTYEVVLWFTATGTRGSIFGQRQKYYIKVIDDDSEPLECGMPCRVDPDNLEKLTFADKEGNPIIHYYTPYGNGWRCWRMIEAEFNGRTENYLHWKGNSDFSEALPESGFFFNESVCGDWNNCLTDALWGTGVDSNNEDCEGDNGRINYPEHLQR